MSIILEVDSSNVDNDLPCIELEDSFMNMNNHVDETNPQDDSVSASGESQSESSDSSYLNIDLDDDTDDEEIDTTESMDLDEQQPNRDLEEVSSDMTLLILKLPSMIRPQVDIEAAELPHSEEDLCSSIPGMFRILDLISERGTSGLGMMHDGLDWLSHPQSR